MQGPLSMRFPSYLCDKCTKRPPLCYNCNLNEVDPNQPFCFNCFACTPNAIICTKCSTRIGNEHSFAYLCKDCQHLKNNCTKCKGKLQ